MKVIDLLNKMANKEELPNKFFFEEEAFTYDKNRGLYFDRTNETFGERFNLEMAINDEIEIIEKEKTIEIHNLKELDEYAYMDEYNEHEVEENRYAINALIRAVKQLDKKISEVK